MAGYNDQRVTTPVANRSDGDTDAFTEDVAPANPRAVIGDNRPPTAEDALAGLGNMLPRREAGRYLKRKYGFGAASTLAQLAMDGQGPPFFKPSTTLSIYPVDGLDEWAIRKLGEARRTFNETAAKVA